LSRLDKLLSTLDKLLAIVDKLSNGSIVSNQLICKLLSSCRHLIRKLLDKLIGIIGKLLKVLLSKLSNLTRIGAKVVIYGVGHCVSSCSHKLTDHFLKTLKLVKLIDLLENFINRSNDTRLRSCQTISIIL